MADGQLTSVIGIPIIVSGWWGAAQAKGCGTPSLAGLLRIPIQLGAFLGRLAGVSGGPWAGWSDSLSDAVRKELTQAGTLVRTWMHGFPLSSAWNNSLEEALANWEEQVEKALSLIKEGGFGWPMVFELRDSMNEITGACSRAEEDNRKLAWEFNYFLSRNGDLLGKVRDSEGNRAPDAGLLSDQLLRLGKISPADYHEELPSLMDINRKLSELLLNGETASPEVAAIHEDFRFCRALAGYLQIGTTQSRMRQLFQEAAASQDIVVLTSIQSEVRRLLQKKSESDLLERMQLRHLQAQAGLLLPDDPLQQLLVDLARGNPIGRSQLSRLAKKIEESFSLKVEQEDRARFSELLLRLLGELEIIFALPGIESRRLAELLHDGQIVAMPTRISEFSILARLSPDQELTLRVIRIVATSMDKGRVAVEEQAQDRDRQVTWNQEIDRLLDRFKADGILWIELWRGFSQIDRMTRDQLEKAKVDLRNIRVPRAAKGGWSRVSRN